MKSYIIHLVRHGMTEANIKGMYAGTSDIPLCDDGIKQLKELREKYDYGRPDLIFSSPLKRCQQTVKLLYGDNAKINIVEGLHEICMGDFEGKTAEEIMELPEYTDWVRGISGPPNGENNKEFATRVCTAFVQTVQRIMKAGLTESVICAHGGVIMTLLAVYGITDEPDETGIKWMANNGRGFTIRVTPSIFMRTGMVEIVSEYPKGSAEEPDLTINPVKKGAFSFNLDTGDIDEITDDAAAVSDVDYDVDEENSESGDLA